MRSQPSSLSRIGHKVDLCMHITALMVLTYIACCIRIRTAPWRYFQLNARYFSEKHDIFSKLELDLLVPERWRLAQSIDSPDLHPETFPVFLKPEWGQNAKGIYRADDPVQLTRLRAQLAAQPQRYLLQEAAHGKHEFEIFGINANKWPEPNLGSVLNSEHKDGQPGHEVLTITEAVNSSETYPINSKFNNQTRYVEITSDFTQQEQQALSDYLSELGHFGISRLSVRADSREDMLAGQFHVIEINLFVPMPINLLDDALTAADRWRFIRRAMMSLAVATKNIVPVARQRPIFTLMMLYGRRRVREQALQDKDGGVPSSMHSHHG